MGAKLTQDEKKDRVIAIARDLHEHVMRDVDFDTISDAELAADSEAIDQKWRDLAVSFRVLDGEDIRVVKVQASIQTNKPKRQVLIYDESREWQWDGDLECEILELLKGGLKTYQYGFLDEQKRVTLIGPAPDQEW